MIAVPRRRVLIAVSRPAQARLASLLADCDLRFVESDHQMLGALDEDSPSFVILGAHYDESNTLGALEKVLAHPHARGVVCVCGSRGQLGRASIDGLRLACVELGALDFVDLTEGEDDSPGNALLRQRLERLFCDAERRAPAAF